MAQNAPPAESGSLRNSLYGSIEGGSASYQPGKGLTFSTANAEDFTINISGQVQAGFYSVDDDDELIGGAAGPSVDNSNGFETRAARMRLGGNVFNENITYFIQTDFAGDDLVDGWAGWQMSKGLNLRLGQQKMRSSLQADASLSDNVGEMVDSSIATQRFAGGRSTGALLEGNSGRFNWHFGAMNNSTAGVDAAGQANAAGENELGYTLGFSTGSDSGNSESWSEGDLKHGGNLSWIGGASLLMINEGADEASSINVFAGLKSGSGLAAQLEIFIRDDETFDSEGLYGQVSYTAAPTGGTQFGGVARYSTVDVDGAETSELSLGVNGYYHEHAMKTQLQIATLEGDGLAGEATRLDLLFTLVF